MERAAVAVVGQHGELVRADAGGGVGGAGDPLQPGRDQGSRPAAREVAGLAGAAGDGSVGEVGGEVGEGQTGGVGGHGDEAGGGEAGAGVDLQNLAGAFGGEDGVDSGDVAAAEGEVGGVGRLEAVGGGGGVEVGGDSELGGAVGVAGGEVVPALLGADLDRWEGREAVDHREGAFGADHPFFEQDGVVVAEGGHEGGRELVGAFDQTNAEGRPAAV